MNFCTCLSVLPANSPAQWVTSLQSLFRVGHRVHSLHAIAKARHSTRDPVKQHCLPYLTPLVQYLKRTASKTAIASKTFNQGRNNKQADFTGCKRGRHNARQVAARESYLWEESPVLNQCPSTPSAGEEVLTKYPI